MSRLPLAAAFLVGTAAPVGFLLLLPGLQGPLQVMFALLFLGPGVLVSRLLLRSAIPDERRRRTPRSILMACIALELSIPLFREPPNDDPALAVLLLFFVLYHVGSLVRRLLDQAVRRRSLARSTSHSIQIWAGAVLLGSFLLDGFSKRWLLHLGLGPFILSGFMGAWFLGKGIRRAWQDALKRKGKSWDGDLGFALWITISGALWLLKDGLLKRQAPEAWRIWAGGALTIFGLLFLLHWSVQRRRSRNAAQEPPSSPVS